MLSRYIKKGKQMEITKKVKCTGCGACAAVCPKQCIVMIENEEGFKYPFVNTNSCISCNKCINSCPINISCIASTKPKAYALQAYDSSILKNSSSGGCFTILAEHILDNGGVVFGAAFNNDYEVEHICIKSKSDLWRLQGSKYVQSDIELSYKEISQYLSQNREVLFVGTPCQTEGIYNYLGNKKNDNLILVDILCHGVPSRKVWRKYLKYRELTDGDKPDRIYFRNKDISWKSFSMKFEYANKRKRTYSKSLNEDMYLRGFLRNLYLRPSCYNCAFKSLYRNTDLTIGDFWEIKDFSQNFNMAGTSLVFAHTLRGIKLINEVKDKAKIEEFEDAERIPNGGLYKSAFYNIDRKAFFKNLDRYDFPVLYKKYFSNKLFTRIKRIISRQNIFGKEHT